MNSNFFQKLNKKYLQSIYFFVRYRCQKKRGHKNEKKKQCIMLMATS